MCFGGIDTVNLDSLCSKSVTFYMGSAPPRGTGGGLWVARGGRDGGSLPMGGPPLKSTLG